MQQSHAGLLFSFLWHIHLCVTIADGIDMNIYHISDVKKYARCPHLFLRDRQERDQSGAAKTAFIPFVRLDMQVSDIAARKLGIHEEKAFIGQKGDDPSLALAAMKDHDWLIKARFVYDRLRVKAPFLHRNGDGWDLYFVYTGLYPMADDMLFYTAMVWVLEHNNISLKQMYVIHLNPDYVRNGDLDPDKLFIISDCFYNISHNPTKPVKEQIYAHARDLKPLLDGMDACTFQTAGAPAHTSKCNGRTKCRYYDICFPHEKEIPDNSILTLSAARYKYDMEKEGRIRLQDADVERIEGTRMQYAQILADKNGGLFVDKAALSTWLSRIHTPITYLDFEWERFAIPPYEGMRPYDVLPFEYSVHVQDTDGSIRHNVFLGIHDDRKAMVEGLLQDIPLEGTVLAYNADAAEKIRLQELAHDFPQYADRLLDIAARLEDLQLPFVTGTVYDVRMGGQWSLKKIMAMMNDKSYNDLAINQGMEAVSQWRHLDHEEHGANDQDIIDGLKKYCGMDSYAMIVVYNWLKKIAKEG